MWTEVTIQVWFFSTPNTSFPIITIWWVWKIILFCFGFGFFLRGGKLCVNISSFFLSSFCIHCNLSLRCICYPWTPHVYLCTWGMLLPVLCVWWTVKRIPSLSGVKSSSADYNYSCHNHEFIKCYQIGGCYSLGFVPWYNNIEGWLGLHETFESGKKCLHE